MSLWRRFVRWLKTPPFEGSCVLPRIQFLPDAELEQRIERARQAPELDPVYRAFKRRPRPNLRVVK